MTEAEPAINGDGYSSEPVLSGDGQLVAFSSAAGTLVAEDRNGVVDIFVREWRAGATERISVATDGSEANKASSQPAMTPDGRWVAFTSVASNLVAGDTNGVADIFVRDRQQGTTQRVSIASDQREGNLDSYSPTISADGRYVAFVSSASTLVARDTNDAPDIFIHDRETGETVRVSVTPEGSEANGWSNWPSLSMDGRFVAFGSSATNLSEEGRGGLFVREWQAGESEWVGDGFAPALSADGRWVAFLATDGATGWITLFLHDRQASSTVPIHPVVESLHGMPGREVALSADGRWLAFWTVAPASGTEQGTDPTIMIYDHQTGTTRVVSTASDGTVADAGSGSPSISADGRFIAFESNATNMVNDDTNGTTDVFVADWQANRVQKVTVSERQ